MRTQLVNSIINCDRLVFLNELGQSRAYAPLNVKDEAGCTPIHYFAYNIYSLYIFLRIEEYDELEIISDDDVIGGEVEIIAGIGIRTPIKLLKFNPNVQDNVGKTPLHYAVIKEHNLMVKYLLAKGADKNIKDLDDKRPVDYAVWGYYKELLKDIEDEDECKTCCMAA
jgi:hypothetical protein